MKKTIIILSLLLSFICSLGQQHVTVVFTIHYIPVPPNVDTIWRTPGKDSIQFRIRSFANAITRYHAILDSTGSGGGSITADNGLTETGSNIQLGGTLTEATTIDADAYGISMSGPGDLGQLLDVSVTGASSGIAIRANGGTNGTGVWSISESGAAGYFVSNGASVGVYARSLAGIPLVSSIFNTATNTVLPALRLERATTGGGGVSGNGIGGSIQFANQSTVGGMDISNEIISKWTIANTVTRTSELSITGVNSGTSNVLLTVSGAGIFTLVQGLTDYADNSAALSGGLTAGQLYRTTDIVKIVH